MPRGIRSEDGAETVNANGYTQIKVEGKWIGKHTHILQERLGRKLVPGERAIFKDNDRTNLSEDNVVLSEAQNTKSIQARIAKLSAEIDDRVALIQDLQLELTKRTDE
jgi:hypothetical protein